MADLQPGSLPTTFTAGADTDYIPISRGAQTGRMLRSEALADVPRLLDTVVEAGATWTLTRAAHSNREVISTNVAATTITFDTTGMTLSDGGRISRSVAALASLSGASFVFSPGVSASAAIPAAAGGWLDWRYQSPGVILIQEKSEDATGVGGGGFIQDQRQSAFVAAAGAAGSAEVLATLNFTALTVGQRIHVTGLWSAASWSNTNCTLVICAVNIGGVQVAQVTLATTGGTIGTAGYTGHRSVDIDSWFTVRALSGAGALVGSALSGRTGSEPNLNAPHAAAATVNAPFVATFTVQRQGANDLAVGLEQARITVE